MEGRIALREFLIEPTISPSSSWHSSQQSGAATNCLPATSPEAFQPASLPCTSAFAVSVRAIVVARSFEKASLSWIAFASS
jgi:hypothetical protein